MENFCKDLKKHVTKTINYEKKEMIPLTREENISYKKQKVCYICEKEFNTDDNNKRYHKVRYHFIIPENIEEVLKIFVI